MCIDQWWGVANILSGPTWPSRTTNIERSIPCMPTSAFADASGSTRLRPRYQTSTGELLTPLHQKKWLSIPTCPFRVKICCGQTAFQPSSVARHRISQVLGGENRHFDGVLLATHREDSETHPRRTEIRKNERGSTGRWPLR